MSAALLGGRACAGIRMEGLRTAPILVYSIYIFFCCANFEFADATLGFPSWIDAARATSAFYTTFCFGNVEV